MEQEAQWPSHERNFLIMGEMFSVWMEILPFSCIIDRFLNANGLFKYCSSLRKMTLVAEPFQVENSLPVVVCVPISTGFSQKAISFIIHRL
jgi:hypothetical protein